MKRSRGRRSRSTQTVITRLVRTCALERVIPYSEAAVIRPMDRGVLGAPVKPGGMTAECEARSLQNLVAYPAISNPAFAYTTPPSTAMVLPTT